MKLDLYLNTTHKINSKWIKEGHLGGSVVERLPLTQVVIPGSWDQVHMGLSARSLLLPLPVSASLCVSLMNE